MTLFSKLTLLFCREPRAEKRGGTRAAAVGE